MAIKAYLDENGKQFYMAMASVRSKINPKIRKQKKQRGIPTKAKAERIERKLYEKAFEEVSSIDGQGFYWGRIVILWHEYKKTDKFNPISPPVLSDYLSSLKTWTKDQWNKPAQSFTRGDVRSIIKKLEDCGKSKSFQAKMKGTINRVFTWAIEEGYIKNVMHSPTFGISINRKAERVPTILNREEIFRLLAAAKELQNPWYPIWSMALLTGCRNGELFAMVWDDIDFTNMTLRVSKSYNKRMRETKSTKAGYWRNIPINEDLKNLLLELKANSKSDIILPRLSDWQRGYQARELKKFCTGIGITPIRFHDLRACFATQLLQNKVPPATVMKICGWKELDTMGRYIRLAGIDEMGATDSLKLLPQKSAFDSILRFQTNTSKT